MKKLFAAGAVVVLGQSIAEAQVDSSYVPTEHQQNLGEYYCNEPNSLRGGVLGYNHREVICEDTSERRYSHISNTLRRAEDRRQREIRREQRRVEREQERREKRLKRKTRDITEACVEDRNRERCEQKAREAIFDNILGN